MKPPALVIFYAALIILVVLIAGCTTNTAAPATPQATPAPAAAATSEFPVPTAAVKTADIDTTITVRFNDFACLDVQEELGKIIKQMKHCRQCRSDAIGRLGCDVQQELESRTTEQG